MLNRADAEKKSLQQWWLLLLVVFAIHNLEEIMFDMYGWEMSHRLPFWVESGRKFHELVQLTPLRFLVIVLVLCSLVAGTAYLLRNRSRASRYWITTFAVLMLTVYVGHVVTSIYAHSPMPGVYSSVLQGVPVHSFVLYQLWRTRARTGDT